MIAYFGGVGKSQRTISSVPAPMRRQPSEYEPHDTTSALLRGDLCLSYHTLEAAARRRGREMGSWGRMPGASEVEGGAENVAVLGGDGDEADAGMAGYGAEEGRVRLLENAEDGQLAV